MKLKEVLTSLPETNKNIVSLISGGLDSTILTYLLVHKYGADKVFALSFNYGQKQKLELDMAAKTCLNLGISHKILDLSILGEISKNVTSNISGTKVSMPTINDVQGDTQPSTYIPFRNMILNSIAFSFAESNNASYVFTGFQIHDDYGYWDTTQSFVDSMNAVANQNRKNKVNIIAPFSNLSKYEELNIAKELGNVVFENTLTCYNPNEIGESCGKCPSCSERIQNFKSAGIIDPIPYSIKI